jgi:hypothetical protein
MKMITKLSRQVFQSLDSANRETYASLPDMESSFTILCLLVLLIPCISALLLYLGLPLELSGAPVNAHTLLFDL